MPRLFGLFEHRFLEPERAIVGEKTEDGHEIVEVEDRERAVWLMGERMRAWLELDDERSRAFVAKHGPSAERTALVKVRLDLTVFSLPRCGHCVACRRNEPCLDPPR